MLTFFFLIVQMSNISNKTYKNSFIVYFDHDAFLTLVAEDFLYLNKNSQNIGIGLEK